MRRVPPFLSKPSRVKSGCFNRCHSAYRCRKAKKNTLLHAIRYCTGHYLREVDVNLLKIRAANHTRYLFLPLSIIRTMKNAAQHPRKYHKKIQNKPTSNKRAIGNYLREVVSRIFTTWPQKSPKNQIPPIFLKLCMGEDYSMYKSDLERFGATRFPL